jgi:hypothetical protein
MRLVSGVGRSIRAMIANANEYVRQFLDEDIESLIALYVLDKYFALSGQSPRLGIYPMNGNAG